MVPRAITENEQLAHILKIMLNRKIINTWPRLSTSPPSPSPFCKDQKATTLKKLYILHKCTMYIQIQISRTVLDSYEGQQKIIINDDKDK